MKYIRTLSSSINKETSAYTTIVDISFLKVWELTLWISYGVFLSNGSWFKQDSFLIFLYVFEYISICSGQHITMFGFFLFQYIKFNKNIIKVANLKYNKI